MKQLKNLAVFAIVAGLSVAVSGSLHAQVAKVSMSSAYYEQAGTSGTRTPAPTRSYFSTADMVAQLTTDMGSFPAGGKLCFDGTGFEVCTFTNGVLATSASTAPFLTFQLTGANVFTNGSTGSKGAFSTTTNQIGTISYNNSGSAVFSVTGLASVGGSATGTNVHGVFKAGVTFNFAGGIGEGTYGSKAVIFSGFTSTGTGSATE